MENNISATHTFEFSIPIKSDNLFVRSTFSKSVFSTPNKSNDFFFGGGARLKYSEHIYKNKEGGQAVKASP